MYWPSLTLTSVSAFPYCSPHQEDGRERDPTINLILHPWKFPLFVSKHAWAMLKLIFPALVEMGTPNK